MSDYQQDAVDAYTASQERVEVLQKAWRDAGQPVLLHGVRGGISPHPLLRALASAEKHAERMRRSVSRPRMGRPEEAKPQLRVPSSRRLREAAQTN